MDGTSWLRSLEGGSAGHRQVEWLDVLVYAEEQHPGPGNAARWLAEQMGVKRRTAERYLAITTPGVSESFQPRSAAAKAAAGRLQDRIQAEWDRADAEDRRQQVADLLRLIRRVKPGRVKVFDTSPIKGATSERNMKDHLDVDLSKVADAWEDGDDDQAADELSDAIVNAYGESGGVAELEDNLRITDYTEGIDWS